MKIEEMLKATVDASVNYSRELKEEIDRLNKEVGRLQAELTKEQEEKLKELGQVQRLTNALRERQKTEPQGTRYE